MTGQLQKRPVELSRHEVEAKNPQVPPLVILKIDVQRRGVHYTEKALSILDPVKHQTNGTHIFGTRDGSLVARPESFLLRDGTSVITTPTPLELNPYVVDLHEGKPWLFDGGEAIEEVEYWPAPAFYYKTSRSGVPMRNIVSARPQRLNIFPHRYCTFWNNNKGCAFCDIVHQMKKQVKELHIPARLDPLDVAEAVAEALKESGRFATLFLTSGSNIAGDNPFDAEVSYYIAILREVGKLFRTKKYPSQLIGTAFSEEQLHRLYDETGLTSYTSQIEVLDERLFNEFCPGKAEWIGYQEWKRRLKVATKIFGRGRVGTGFVAGIELTKPHGFATEDEALGRILEQAEELADHGVVTTSIVWSPRPGTRLGDQNNASLDYYVRLAWSLHELRRKYELDVTFDDYRRCGNHGDTDLDRLP